MKVPGITKGFYIVKSIDDSYKKVDSLSENDIEKFI
jgi:hypothetical protein